jgi:glyoxylase-like metal-dependent hydrolase (beta-lactamase superfamily II)
LFQGSIGRTDLPGGNHAQLIRAIETQIFTLPPETTICPGHGPSTTVQREQTYNPYL